VNDLIRLFEILAQHRAETGTAATFDQAIADIKTEMSQDGAFDDDDE
jgi:hypothetical protein